MSFQAMTWATEQELPCSQKMVLLMLANRTNHDTGRCDPSHKRLARDCGLSQSAVKRAISALAEAGLVEVVHRSHEGVNLPNHYRLTYGVQHEGGGVTVNPGWGHSEPRVGSQGATNQELNLESNQTPCSPPAQRGRYSDEFEQWWSEYPRRARKADAYRAWKRMTAEDRAAAAQDVPDRIKRHAPWLRDAGKYIPHAATYLNGRRWEDDIEEGNHAQGGRDSGQTDHQRVTNAIEEQRRREQGHGG